MTNTFEFFAGLTSFIIVVVILKIFLFGSMKNAVQERSSSYRSSLNEAEDMLQQAEKQAEIWLSKKNGLSKELDEIRQKAKSDSERLFNDAVNGAKNEAERIIKDASSEAENLREALRHTLQSDLVDRVADKAEKLIRQSVKDEDVKRNVVENMLTRMGAHNA